MTETKTSAGRTPLGEILVKRGKITQAQLTEALEQQAKDPRLIGEILVEKKYLEEPDIVAALVVQFGVPYVAIGKYIIEPSVLGFIPVQKIKELGVIPVDKNDDVLSVVMPDPLRKDIISQLESLTGLKIAPFVASREEIRTAIQRHYG